MGRHPRAIVEGGTYHVMNRGNRKLPIFADDHDHLRFLQIFMEEAERYDLEILGECQLWNHFHAVLVTPHANLSEFMAQLESRFARYSNWRHDHVGHVFQGPFRHVAIEHDIHLLIALCYVFFNPVSAGLVAKPEQYRWSSYAATVGHRARPRQLSLDWLASLFPADSIQDSQRRFHSLMSEGRPVQVYLEQIDFGVDADAVHRVLFSYVGHQVQLGLLPKKYRSVLRSPLSALLVQGVGSPECASAIYDAHVVHGYKLAEIAGELRSHPATVSKIFRLFCSSRAKPA